MLKKLCYDDTSIDISYSCKHQVLAATKNGHYDHGSKHNIKFVSFYFINFSHSSQPINEHLLTIVAIITLSALSNKYFTFIAPYHGVCDFRRFSRDEEQTQPDLPSFIKHKTKKQRFLFRSSLSNCFNVALNWVTVNDEGLAWCICNQSL